MMIYIRTRYLEVEGVVVEHGRKYFAKERKWDC